MKKIITLFSFLMLLIVGLPNVVAQNNQGQQIQIENSVDDVTYQAVKEKCRLINKLLDLSSRQYDALVEIMLHSEVKKAEILSGNGNNQEKLLAEVTRFELEKLSDILNERQFTRYKESLEE